MVLELQIPAVSGKNKKNGSFIFTQIAVPAPGQTVPVGAWNYWHNLLVTKNTPTGSNPGTYVKWSQPPDAKEEEDPVIITGWDEWSDYTTPPAMADDWECNDVRSVTDIHWWGSFKGWTLNKPPTIMPKSFHLGIWTDVAATDPCNEFTFSHPVIINGAGKQGSLNGTMIRTGELIFTTLGKLRKTG